MGTEYYRFNFRRLTVSECWRLAAVPGAFTNLLLLKFGLVTLDTPVAEPALDEWPGIDPDEVPKGVARRLDRFVAPLTAAGFRVLVYGRQPTLERYWSYYSVLLLSADRETGVVVTDSKVGEFVQTNAGLTTRFTDGTYGITTTEQYALGRPPELTWDNQPGLPPDRVYDRHRANLARWQDAGRVVAPFADHEGPLESLRLTRLMRDDLTARGVLVRMTADEVEDHEWEFG